MGKEIKYFDSSDALALFRWLWKSEKNNFEEEFAKYIGVTYALGTNYGRTALYVGLRAIDAKDTEVIVPAYICSVVRHAVIMAGAIPRFVDIDFDLIDFDIEDLKSKITSKTKAILLTHFFGRVSRHIEQITLLAKENNIILIEDCAHALGAEYKGRKAGSFGDFSIFSLTKNMINCGGGVLVTSKNDIYTKARDILKKEKKDFKKRIVDFPIVFAYGTEQAINKLMFDRGKKIRGWYRQIPILILKMRILILRFVKLPRIVAEFIKRERKCLMNGDKPHEGREYKQDINMESIIASLGRNQLRKIDSLIVKRKKTYNELSSVSYFSSNRAEDRDFTDAYTHLVLKFSNQNIVDIADSCNRSGPLLRVTWPVRQKLWENQETVNVLRIKNEIMLINLSPDLTQREIGRFTEKIAGIKGKDLSDKYGLHHRCNTV